VRSDGRIGTTEAWELTEIMARGATFEAAWRQVSGGTTVPAAPFRRAIRLRRLDHGETISSIARRTGVKADTLYAIAQGRNQFVRRSTAAPLAQGLGLEPTEVSL
jgi:hypothetical protein